MRRRRSAGRAPLGTDAQVLPDRLGAGEPILLAVQRGERVLHEVLGRRDVVDQGLGDPDERRPVRRVQRDEVQPRADDGGSRLLKTFDHPDL